VPVELTVLSDWFYEGVKVKTNLELPGDETDVPAKLRGLLKPFHVDRSRSPKWILPIVRRLISGGRLPECRFALTSAGIALEHAAKFCGDSWLDHDGKVKIDGFEFLVSEPYAEHTSLKMLQELEAFCELLGAGYTFTANSEHFPGRTIRIVVAESPRLALAFRQHEFFHTMASLQSGTPRRRLPAR
jgi:hypothetical protein